MYTIEEIKIILSRNKKELRDKYSVKDIGVFGSRLRGANIEGSDIDILVEFEESPGYFKFLDLEEYLSKLLEMKVDLVVKSALKPRIGKRILEEVEYI